jgi:hypothetical protein
MRGRGGDLGAVDRHHADPDQAAARTQRQHLAEQARDRRLMANAEARDRRVIGRVVGGDDAERDIVLAAPLDRARGPHTDRVAVDEQRDHHRRIVRRTTPPVVAIGRVERRQIHLGDCVQHEPREVALGQPLAQARRQQQLLLAITRDEVLRHHRMVLTTPDRPGLCDTLRETEQSQARSIVGEPGLHTGPACPVGVPMFNGATRRMRARAGMCT